MIVFNQIPNVPEVTGNWLSLAHHHLLCAQLPGRVQQQGGHSQVREQCDEHSPIQLFTAPLLAAQLHGRLHLVVAFRGREGDRDARQRAQHLLRRRAHQRGRGHGQ